MIKIITACSINGVIGVKNKIPWHYPEDMKRFKEITINSTVIMGRKTRESIGKLLPKRRNIVISNSLLDGYTMPKVEIFTSLEQALEYVKEDQNIWIIGGATLYQQGMQYADEIDLTIIPEIIEEKNAIFFPWINPLQFEIKNKPLITITQNNKILTHFIYHKLFKIET